MCYFRALKLGDAARVAPIDKLSVVLVAVFGAVFLGERLSGPIGSAFRYRSRRRARGLQGITPPVSLMTSVQHLSRDAFGRARHEVGLVVALFVIAGGLLGFGYIAEEVVEGDTTAFDRHVLLLFRHASDLSTPIGPAWLQEMARDVTSLGSYAVLGLMFVLVLGYIVMLGKRGAAVFILTSVLGGQILSTVLKTLFERPRPDLVPHATQVFTASFPSAHAMLSALTYLTLGALLTRVVPSHRVKVYVMSAASVPDAARRGEPGVPRRALAHRRPSGLVCGVGVGRPVLGRGATSSTLRSGRETVRNVRPFQPGLMAWLCVVLLSDQHRTGRVSMDSALSMRNPKSGRFGRSLARTDISASGGQRSG